jgi:hypothetical protein
MQVHTNLKKLYVIHAGSHQPQEVVCNTCRFTPTSRSCMWTCMYYIQLLEVGVNLHVLHTTSWGWCEPACITYNFLKLVWTCMYYIQLLEVGVNLHVLQTTSWGWCEPACITYNFLRLVGRHSGSQQPQGVVCNTCKFTTTSWSCM